MADAEGTAITQNLFGVHLTLSYLKPPVLTVSSPEHISSLRKTHCQLMRATLRLQEAGKARSAAIQAALAAGMTQRAIARELGISEARVTRLIEPIRLRDVFSQCYGSGPWKCYFGCALGPVDCIVGEESKRLGFTIHHLDGNDKNNAVENLAPAHRCCHNRYHANEKWKEGGALRIGRKVGRKPTEMVANPEARRLNHAIASKQTWDVRRERYGSTGNRTRGLECQYCGREFTYPRNLMRHELTCLKPP